MRYIASLSVLLLVVLSSPAARCASPRRARVVIGRQEVTLSPRPVVEGDVVYAPVELLKRMGADYAAGESSVSVALAEGSALLDIAWHEGAPMIRVDEAAKALEVDYNWDSSTSTVRLLSKLVAVEFDNGALTAKLTLPVTVSSARLWPKPWRISIDLAGAKVATDAWAYSVSGSDVSRIRLGQFNDDTARIVLDLGRKSGYQVITKGPSREIKVLVGSQTGSGRAPGTAAQPEPAPPVNITAVAVEPADDSKVGVRISASAGPTFKAFMVGRPPRVVVDVQNATLAMPADDIPVEHSLLRGIRTGKQNGALRIVFDLTRYVDFSASADGNDILLSIGLPSGAGGRLSDKTIVIDPGHGGDDPGARAGGVKEKNLNLAIAFKLREALEETGAKVVLVRDGDRYVDLYDRPAVADGNGAQFFISIHCNALVPEAMSGITTYYHPGQPSSRALALSIHNRLIEETGMVDHGARLDTVLYRSGLAVLRSASVPAILVECGFIDCTRDREKLCSDVYRAKLARAIVDGLREYTEGGMAAEAN